MTASEILQYYFGYDTFRNGQETLISHILQGQDVFGIMPTGAGKSLCYQIPALMMNGLTIVISPLISLMQDQVTALRMAGIPAGCLNSMMDEINYKSVLRQVYQGKIKLLYVAPERLETASMQKIANEIPVSMITVDEVHCVSQWGQDFRPSYLKIVSFLKYLPYRPVLSVFTATATKEVAEDVKNILHLKNPFCLTTGFNRKNLYFSVAQPRDKFEALLQFLKQHPDENGIVYCISRRLVEEVTEDLNHKGFSAVRYHAGLTDKERYENQEAFLYDKVRLIVATNAFGMGIDKSDVSFVIHYNMPKNIENYYQEAGRAGRDGSPANCILFYDSSDIRINQYFIDNFGQNLEIDAGLKIQLQNREKQRLKAMQQYCTGSSCLRHYLLEYFGDTAPEYCGNCSFCRIHCEQKDITSEAQKIISCIYYLYKRNLYFDSESLIQILRAGKTEKYQQLQLSETLPTYGIMRDISEKQCLEIIKYLISTGMLSEKEQKLCLNRKSGLFLKEKQTLSMPVRKTGTASVQNKENQVDTDEALLSLLKECRQKLSQKEHVPAYVIFTDMTLRDMCRKQPVSDMAFLSVQGVGRVKLEKYGDAFMKVIHKYLDS